jgi:type IV pilus assembly protein PilM
MAEKAVWGLDIGSSAIKVVRIVRGGDEVKIDQFDIVDIPQGDDEKERPSRVRTALAGLVQSRRFGNDPVYVAVPGNICLHREFQLPPGSEDKLADLVQYEAKQQIPFPLEQVEWGFERYDDPNGVGVALIAVRKNDIQDLLALCESFKLNVRGIVPSPISLFNFVRYEFRPDSTTLILDAGAKGIDFVVLNGRQFYFRTIQIAGREITRSLENKFKVPFDKAEELKKNVAKSPQMDKIMSVIEPTMRQVGAEVQRTIGFYKAKARGQRISQCYLLGHTFRLPKMAEYLQGQVREAPFALVEGLQRVKLDFSINANVWNNEFPTMAVAIGAGLQGLGLTELSLNLLPKQVVQEQARAGWKAWVAAAAVFILVALGFSHVQAEKAKGRFVERKTALLGVKEQIDKPKKDEVKAVESMAGQVELLKRYSRLGRDAGRVNAIFARLASLRASDGKPFFGPENKAHLTGLFVSRIPFGTRDGALPDAPDRNLVKDYDHIKGGPTSFYAPLAKGADPQSIAPEMRPDVPLVVVLTGEVEGGQNALATITKLRDLLSEKEKFPEVQDLRLERIENGSTHTVTSLKYDWSGKLMGGGAGAAAPATPVATPEPGAVAAPKEKKTQNTVFHLMFRWNSPDDPDREPEAVAAPEKGPKKAAAKKN